MNGVWIPSGGVTILFDTARGPGFVRAHIEYDFAGVTYASGAVESLRMMAIDAMKGVADAFVPATAWAGASATAVEEDCTTIKCAPYLSYALIAGSYATAATGAWAYAVADCAANLGQAQSCYDIPNLYREMVDAAHSASWAWARYRWCMSTGGFLGGGGPNDEYVGQAPTEASDVTAATCSGGSGGDGGGGWIEVCYEVWLEYEDGSTEYIGDYCTETWVE